MTTIASARKRERQREREHEARGAPSIEAYEAERGEAVECETSCGEHELRAVELLGFEGAVEGWELGERDDGPDSHQPAEPGQQERRAPDDTARSLGAELDGRRSREDAGDDEPERRRELEAGVRAEQHRRRGKSVQPEEPRARDERERDEEESRVASPACGGADRPAESRRHRGGAEHQPEVRLLVLPADVDRRARKQNRKQDERSGDDGEPGTGVHAKRGQAKA